MADKKLGTVTVTIPDHITIPAEAGTMDEASRKRLSTARKGIGLTAARTAEAIRKNPDRLAIPGVLPEKLEADGKAAEDIGEQQADLEAMQTFVSQVNQLLDHQAHQNLRRVLAFVRAQEKFDPRIVDLVPDLIKYFANERSSSESDVEEPTGT